MPGVQSIHQNAVLSNVSVQYKNAGFIAEQIFPIVKVKKESDIFYKYKKGTMFEIPNTRRAPKSGYQRVDWGVETDTYQCHEEGLEELIDDREKDNADTVFNLQVDTTEIVTEQVMLAREKRVFDLVQNTSNLTNNSTPSVKWDATSGDPLSDVSTARLAFNLACGKIPNVGVISLNVFEGLKGNANVKDQFKYTSSESITVEMLAKYFELDKLLVAYGLYNSAKKGQSASLTRLWGKNMLLAYVNPRPSIKQALSLGYQFQSKPRATFKYRDEEKASDVIRVREITDEKLVTADCGYLLTNVTTS
jgi:hypothetical protein